MNNNIFLIIYFLNIIIINIMNFHIFKKQVLINPHSDNREFKFLIFISFIPVINFIIIAMIIIDKLFILFRYLNNLFDKKLNKTKEKTITLENEYILFKNELINIGYFKNENEINEFINGIKISNKLRGGI